MTTLATHERRRLAAILGMLGSDSAGERDNAARMAEEFRRQHGLTWNEVVGLAAVPEVTPEPPPSPEPPPVPPAPEPKPEPKAAPAATPGRSKPPGTPWRTPSRSRYPAWQSGLDRILERTNVGVLVWGFVCGFVALFTLAGLFASHSG